MRALETSEHWKRAQQYENTGTSSNNAETLETMRNRKHRNVGALSKLCIRNEETSEVLMNHWNAKELCIGVSEMGALETWEAVKAETLECAENIGTLKMRTLKHRKHRNMETLETSER